MKKSLTQTITYVLAGIMLASFLGMFALDSSYSNNPQIPDQSTGRTIPLEIKLHGIVYLTPSENRPLIWLMSIIGACAALIMILYVVDYLKMRRTKSDR